MPARDPPIGGLIDVSPEHSVRMGVRGGGCSLVRTSLSLQIGKSRVILASCSEAPSVIQIKAVRSQEFGWRSPYSRSRETIIHQQGRESRIAKSRITLRRSRQFAHRAPQRTSSEHSDDRVRSEWLYLDP